MKTEPYHLARRAICGVVSVLAAEELKNDRWKDIISHMSDVHTMYLSSFSAGCK